MDVVRNRANLHGFTVWMKHLNSSIYAVFLFVLGFSCSSKNCVSSVSVTSTNLQCISMFFFFYTVTISNSFNFLLGSRTTNDSRDRNEHWKQRENAKSWLVQKWYHTCVDSLSVFNSFNFPQRIFQLLFLRSSLQNYLFLKQDNAITSILSQQFSAENQPKTTTACSVEMADLKIQNTEYGLNVCSFIGACHL